MKILICGGRDLNELLVTDWLKKKFLVLFPEAHQIIEGGARGADHGAKRFCLETRFPCRTFQADWKRHGKSAGPLRNEQMLLEGFPDAVLAFPGGVGTEHMKRISRKAKIPVYEISTEELNDR